MSVTMEKCYQYRGLCYSQKLGTYQRIAKENTEELEQLSAEFYEAIADMDVFLESMQHQTSTPQKTVKFQECAQ